MYCSFNKTYINEDWIQGFNLIKSECSGDKGHRFLLRIEHGEILAENNCILDVKNVDISGSNCGFNIELSQNLFFFLYQLHFLFQN